MHIVSLVFRLPGNFTRESDNNSLPKGSTDARSTTTPLQSVHGHLQVVQLSPPRYASVVFRQGIAADDSTKLLQTHHSTKLILHGAPTASLQKLCSLMMISMQQELAPRGSSWHPESPHIAQPGSQQTKPLPTLVFWMPAIPPAPGHVEPDGT